MLTLALGQAVHVAANKFRALRPGSDGLIVDVPRRLWGFRTRDAADPSGMLIVAVATLV